MGNYIKRTLRFYALIALVPLLVGAIGAWPVPFGLGMLFIILGPLAALIALPIGTIVWINRCDRIPVIPGKERQRRLAIGLAPLLLVVTVAAAVPLVSAGAFAGSLARLAVNRNHYEAIIAKARTAREPALFEVDGGVTYSSALGPPVRVAFNPRDLAAPWGVIAYDPSGGVVRLRGWGAGADTSGYPDGWVGGIYGCRPLWGDYYACSFDF